MKTCVIYGSTNGTTAGVAAAIGKALEPHGAVAVHDIASSGLKPAEDCDLLILGSSTWGIGDMQDDWDGLESLAGINLAGRRIALFGTGDQDGYPDSFVDAMGTLADSVEKQGGVLVGRWPAEGYDFADSSALRNGSFVGLAIDEDNQGDLTGQRIERWVAQLVAEMGQAAMDVFLHHIYEYRKGLRNLILHTAPLTSRDEIIRVLDRRGIAFVIYPVGEHKLNVFFGARECVDVIRDIGKARLNEYTAEEDFILGIMLGYDRRRQCRRFLGRRALHGGGCHCRRAG